ncbi:hypothetical protein FW320_30765, partial [Azospirillum sp. Vi22]|nr:hypothetical protein [Azospirillum baldaniorum]
RVGGRPPPPPPGPAGPPPPPPPACPCAARWRRWVPPHRPPPCRPRRRGPMPTWSGWKTSNWTARANRSGRSPARKGLRCCGARTASVPATRNGWSNPSAPSG